MKILDCLYEYFYGQFACKGRERINRPFPSCLVPLFQSESTWKSENFHMKIISACSFIFMEIKVIFIRMVSHLDSLCNRGTRELELGNGLFHHPFPANGDNISQWMWRHTNCSILLSCVIMVVSSFHWMRVVEQHGGQGRVEACWWITQFLWELLVVKSVVMDTFYVVSWSATKSDG